MLFRRLATLIAVLAVGGTTLAVAPFTTTAASGAQEGTPRVPEAFTLNMVEGELLIRDAEEPYALTNPTSISGTNETDTGSITGGSFSTPQVSIRRDITSPLVASVFIDADFAQVAPNSAIGTVDHEGVMTVQTSLTVDLHIEVQPLGGGQTFLQADCTTSPVVLTLESPEGQGYSGGEVTLADENFSIPEMVVEPSCDPLISGEVNDQLAGAGHSLSLTLEGDLTLPLPPGCATTTTLAASPVGQAKLGTPVALTATVAPVAADPLCVAAASNGSTPEGGFVEFFDGNVSLGSSPIQADNSATLNTAALPAGTRSLVAEFKRFGDFMGSDSSTSPLAYQVNPNPSLSASLPEFVQIGVAAPVEFPVTVRNTGFGTGIDRVRLDVTLKRFSADFAANRVVLEYYDESLESWTPVSLAPESPSGFNTLLWGEASQSTGFSLPAGATTTRNFRIRFPFTGGPSSSICNDTDETCPGEIDVLFDLVEVDESGLPEAAAAPVSDALASGIGRINLVEEVRRASTLTLGGATGPVLPHTVRAGGSVAMSNIAVGPLTAGRRPSGYLSFSLDGQPIGVRHIQASNAPPEATPLSRVPVAFSLTTSVMFDIPTTASIGAHQVTVRYSGNSQFLPIQVSATFTVIESLGAAYDCQSPGLINTRFGAYVEGQANVPAVKPAGTEIDLDHFTLRLGFARDPLGQLNSRNRIAPSNGTRTVGTNNLSIDIDLGPSGEGTGASITRSNGTPLTATTPTPFVVDEFMVINNATGSAVVDGSPGDIVPITVQQIHLQVTDSSGFPNPIVCKPVGQALLLGEVVASGATLTVEPGGPIREGDSVTLKSAVEPYTTGQVEFLANDETVGVANVIDGVAQVVTSAIPAGVHTLTAVYTGGVLAPSLVSLPVPLEVIAIDCPEYAEEGSGAVVRLVYMRLLGRCPDPAGYEYWKGKLDGDTTQQQFADAISSTFEARRQVAKTAYQTMLGRDGDPDGLTFWADYLTKNPYRRMLAAIGDTEEYLTLSGSTNDGFVTRTYQRLLGREPDAAGLSYWVELLEAGLPRFTMLNAFASMDEPAEVVIEQAFAKLLEREPTADELAIEVALYNAGGSVSALYGRLIGKPEFSTLAQEYPNF